MPLPSQKKLGGIFFVYPDGKCRTQAGEKVDFLLFFVCNHITYEYRCQWLLEKIL
jgi:hypothetical protein